MSVRELTPQQVESDLADYHLVDVRETEELVGELGHIEGVEHVPLATLAEHAARLAEHQPLLLVCRSGRRSENACVQLQEAGVAEVVNLAGGMIAWNEAGLPVSREAG